MPRKCSLARLSLMDSACGVRAWPNLLLLIVWPVEYVLRRVCPWCRQPISQVVLLDKSGAQQVYRVTHTSQQLDVVPPGPEED
jgi:hypothetical protein